jgi:hypothetical protein
MVEAKVIKINTVNSSEKLINLYQNVLLYGCETWSLTLREECRLSVFENRVVRKTLWLKWVEVTGEWRRLHNVELYALYSSKITWMTKSRRMRWAGHVARVVER